MPLGGKYRFGDQASDGFDIGPIDISLWGAQAPERERRLMRLWPRRRAVSEVDVSARRDTIIHTYAPGPLVEDQQRELPGALSLSWKRHLCARFDKSAAPQGAMIVAETSDEPWSYCISTDVRVQALAPWHNEDRLNIRVDVRVTQGRLGIGTVVEAWSEYTSAEKTIDAGDAIRHVHIEVDDLANTGHLVFRNAQVNGRSTKFEIHGLKTYATKAGGGPEILDVFSGEAKSLKLTDLLGVLNQVRTRHGDAPLEIASETLGDLDLGIVEAHSLAGRLNLLTSFEPAESSKQKPLTAWRMEEDDAPILAHLYRTLHPRRHLEFGTWEGFGVVNCARNCDAEIWTINLPEGESAQDGAPAYVRSVQEDLLPKDLTEALRRDGAGARTDAGAFIGWMYREAGLEARVNQILADSREWDTSDLPDGFFDSALIDGGHEADIVANDTQNALRLLRPGGLCVWHDFCPAADVLERCQAPRGVVEAVLRNWPRWGPAFRDAFWIRKSWMLIGIKA